MYIDFHLNKNGSRSTTLLQTTFSLKVDIWKCFLWKLTSSSPPNCKRSLKNVLNLCIITQILNNYFLRNFCVVAETFYNNVQFHMSTPTLRHKKLCKIKYQQICLIKICTYSTYVHKISFKFKGTLRCKLRRVIYTLKGLSNDIRLVFAGPSL